MPTTPSGHRTKSLSERKKTTRSPGSHRIERPPHTEDEDNAIDAAVELRLPVGQLHRRIRRLSRQVHQALGRRQDLWLQLEVALNERAIRREAAYFDLGFEHGFAAGRSAKRLPPWARDLAAKLRNLAIQRGPRGTALLAILDVACSLAVEPELPEAKKRTSAGAQPARTKYSSAAILRAGRANIVRDAECAVH